jgi:hypothetical protein
MQTIARTFDSLDHGISHRPIQSRMVVIIESGRVDRVFDHYLQAQKHFLSLLSGKNIFHPTRECRSAYDYLHDSKAMSVHHHYDTHCDGN